MPDQDAMNRGTFVPPTPPTPKARGSKDNPIEMGAGGVEERKALDTMQEQTEDVPVRDDARGDALIQATPPSEEITDIGRSDSSLGTGVGYAGEGAASYGTQGATGDDTRLGSTDRLTANEIAGARKEGTGDV